MGEALFRLTDILALIGFSDSFRGTPRLRAAQSSRECEMEDDGRVPNSIRALKNGELTSKPFEAQGRGDAFLVKGQRWLKLTQMAVDATNFERGDEE